MALTLPEAPSGPTAAGVRGSAFGLDILSASPLGGLAGPVGGRRTSWEPIVDSELDGVWNGRRARTVVHLRYPSGRTFLRVDRGDDDRYRIVTPRHGRHIVAADGAEIRSALPSGSPVRWERLLYAQPLPLAAALQGLELFHASAVAVDGKTVGLIAASGTGKSSIGAHLVAAGAGFVTDDVLALGDARGRVVAFAGPSRLAITGAELRSISSSARPRLGPVVGRADKVIAAPPQTTTSGPLEALVFLSRHRSHAALEIAETRPSPQRLLGSAFLPYLDHPDRLVRRLDLCARVGADIAYLEVSIPEAARAADVAERLIDQLERL